MHEHKHKKYTFHVNGMHCSSCVLLIENELSSSPIIASVKSSLGNRSVSVEGDFQERTQEEVAGLLTEIVGKHGYSLSVNKKKVYKNMSDFKIAVPAAFIFLFIFLLLQKLGIVNMVNASKITYSTAFVIGVVASLSTCMAVVGGLLLSMSATFAKEGDSVRPQVLFHIGRITSFFILGGVIGKLGTLFSFNGTVYIFLNLIIATVMLILGINLLDLFDWAKKLQPTVPGFIAKHTLTASKWNHTLTPFAVGVLTFFLPCGFTQTMQFYTLSLGSFWAGSLIMLAFVLGTFPVLAILSFSSFNINKSSYAGSFFKTIGLIIIAFSLFNIVNTLAAAGYINPIFSF